MLESFSNKCIRHVELTLGLKNIKKILTLDCSAIQKDKKWTNDDCDNDKRVICET